MPENTETSTITLEVDPEDRQQIEKMATQARFEHTSRYGSISVKGVWFWVVVFFLVMAVVN